MSSLRRFIIILGLALAVVAPAMAKTYVHKLGIRTYMVDIYEEKTHKDVLGAVLEMQDNVRPLHLYVWVRVKAKGFKPYRRLVQIFPYYGQRQIKLTAGMERE